jgi:hypothetical protein
MSTNGAERAELERRIEVRRAELGSAIRVLRHSAVETLSPRERFRKDPYPWVALALGAGFWFALRHAARDAK